MQEKQHISFILFKIYHFGIKAAVFSLLTVDFKPHRQLQNTKKERILISRIRSLRKKNSLINSAFSGSPQQSCPYLQTPRNAQILPPKHQTQLLECKRCSFFSAGNQNNPNCSSHPVFLPKRTGHSRRQQHSSQWTEALHELPGRSPYSIGQAHQPAFCLPGCK